MAMLAALQNVEELFLNQTASKTESEQEDGVRRRRHE
jgi:hypothetical protein